MPILTPDERLGTVLGTRYQLDRVLGSGGMGVVFDGVHLLTGRPVAVKVLKPQFAGEQDVVARFFREARAAASLQHPNIIEVLDMGEADDGTPYLVLERLQGEPLAACMSAGERLDPAWVLGALLPVMDALQAAHGKGVIHRDLKPDNIFMSTNGVGEVIPKVLDFGIAKLVDAGARDATATGAIVGTPAYMAPEQAAGKRDVGAQVDVWSIGMVALEAMAGVHPVDDDSSAAVLVRIVTEGVPPAAQCCDGLAPSLCDVLDRALAHDPARRWRTMEEFSAALFDAASTEELDVGYVPVALRDPASSPAAGRDLSRASTGSASHPSRTHEESHLRPTEISDTERPAAPDGGSAPNVEAPPAAPTPRPAESRTTGRRSRLGDGLTGARVLVVRPYGKTIRDRVFGHLEGAGLVVQPEDVIPEGTSDEGALDLVLQSDARILLVPFHGHRDASGGRVDGLSFLRRLDERVGGEFRWRVLMPGSRFAGAALSLGLSVTGGLSEGLRRAILPIYEDDLADAALVDRISRHVRAA